MKKHVCMIAYTILSVDARVRREAETLANLEEYEVFILIPKDKDSPRKYSVDGVKVIELNIKSYQGKNKLKYVRSYLTFFLLSFITCIKFFFSRKIDIVHIHNMPNFLVFAAIIPRLFGKKIILDIHDSVPETYAAKFGKKSNLLFNLLCWEESLSCRFASKIICVNHVQRDALINRGIPASKIEVSMNVPDHKRFKFKGNKKDVVKHVTDFNLVYHGTLTKRLGIDLTIRAVTKLVDKIPGLKFYIIGVGDDAEEFMKLSRSLGLGQIVHFKKAVSIESLTTTLNGMHLGIISNRKNVATELMLPVKMLEYVALNIPVVAPSLKTIRHYFNNGMISYFVPENVDSLSSTILELYHDELKRTKQAMMARRFLEKYGWEKQQYDFIKFYNNLFTNKES